MCKKCKESKHLLDFGKDKSQKDGLNKFCKTCKRQIDKKSCTKNKIDRSLYLKKYYKENKDRYNNKYKEEYRKDYKNKQKEKNYKKEYYLNNKYLYRNSDAKRRTQKINANLKGFEEKIKDIYNKCPKGYHVDHIMPLINKNICGLHVPWNLQYLTQKDNLKKSNSFDHTLENQGWQI